MEDKKKQTYEEGVSRLESIIAMMNGGEKTLEELMGLYEEGMKLAATLEEELVRHEASIRQIDRVTGQIASMEVENVEQEL